MDGSLLTLAGLWGGLRGAKAKYEAGLQLRVLSEYKDQIVGFGKIHFDFQTNLKKINRIDYQICQIIATTEDCQTLANKLLTCDQSLATFK